MSAFEELGARGRGNPYTVTGAINTDCPACGAPAGHRCVMEVEVPTPAGPQRVKRPRRMPCITRVRRGS